MPVDFAAIAADVSAEMATVDAAIAAVGTLRTASPVVLAPVITALNRALSTLDAGIATIDADILTDSVGGIVTGTPAPLLWPVLLAQASDCEQLNRLIEARSYLGRVARNLGEATG